jgi:hypothetical protein
MVPTDRHKSDNVLQRWVLPWFDRSSSLFEKLAGFDGLMRRLAL